jgi:hypothetical protein
MAIILFGSSILGIAAFALDYNAGHTMAEISVFF